jgi:uncharacterized protein (TIGR02117 family)
LCNIHCRCNGEICGAVTAARWVGIKKSEGPGWLVRARGLSGFFLLAAGLCGCATAPPPCVPVPVPRGDVVYLVRHGWHTDIAIPSDELRGNMTVFQRIFPGVRVLVFGFGKRTFMTAPVTTSGDLMVGPFPGDGIILVTGLNTTPDVAYNDGISATLALPASGAGRLSDFVWESLKKDQDAPVELRPGFFPGSIFYVTETRYAGTHTCNTWTADALRAAGLKVDPAGDLFSWQTMSQAEQFSGRVCSIKGNP